MPYCQQYEQRRLTGLQRLFLHYQYKLKILPRNNRCKLSSFEKEELQKAVQKMEELNHLIKERQKVRNLVR